jgi:LuxR family maltose regulon positive regulatory protein
MNGRSETLAKIASPRHRNVIRRQGLFNKLDAARDTPAIWISAPPGYGKTTLISSYLHERDCASIWYHVDESDADIAALFWYLRVAAREIAPATYAQLPPYTSAYKDGLSTFATRYFEKLYA